MKTYEVGNVRYDGKVYFLIRRTEDASICVYPTKYLKHKTTSNRSPNTVKRIAFSLSYFMGYLKEQGRQFEDVYEMTYSAQMEFFQNFLYWVKGGKHISGEVRKIPDNGTCKIPKEDHFCQHTIGMKWWHGAKNRESNAEIMCSKRTIIGIV